MLNKKLLLFMLVTFVSNYSQAGLFIARNFNRFANGAAQAGRSLFRPLSPQVNNNQSLLSELPFAHVDTMPAVDEQLPQSQLGVLPDLIPNVVVSAGQSIHNTLGSMGRRVVDVTTLGPVLREVDAIGNRFNGRLENLSNATTESLRDMSQNIVTGLGTIRADTTRELDAIATRATASINTMRTELTIQVDQMRQDTTQHIDRMRQDTIQELNKTVNRGALLATGVALTSIAGWYGTKFLYNVLDRYYREPKLFSKTSDKSFVQKIKEWAHKPQVELPTLIFDSKKEAELASLARSVKNVNAKIMAGDPTVRHRSVLFWGPPGTGKTAFASKLAQESNMNFREMSGADISKLDVKEALVALDEVLDYAQRSKKGLILMVDEAESLFAKREAARPDSPSYLVLSKFLSMTSGRIKKLMLIVTTNHKEVLDEAFVSRLDKSIEIKLPDYTERLKILRLYKDKYLTDDRYSSAEFIASVAEHLNEYKMEQIAHQLTGCSGRDLESVMQSIKQEAEQLLTTEVVNKVVQDILDKSIQFNSNTADMPDLSNRQTGVSRESSGFHTKIDLLRSCRIT